MLSGYSIVETTNNHLEVHIKRESRYPFQKMNSNYTQSHDQTFFHKHVQEHRKR